MCFGTTSPLCFVLSWGCLDVEKLFAMNQIATPEAFTSCNHLPMDAIQDKQNSIQDEWASTEDNSSNWVVQVGIRGRLFAVVGSMHENIGKYGFAMIQIATSILLILFYNFYHF